ncbi:putative metalloprotease [Janibacter sp. HTCC2649]|uniref:KPN_02809 family neutral zinc metallopeptidase n=1 Tax=Janibacter sp. HTCC2649 TaxID=313589 RepID=UPI000066E9F2|nr:neutral zinc metallopeptidase [Janibacter sp. HTCC2649]EAP99165.1 putative metalloprotease [Janibacter sp. HTCC2649]
MSFNDGAGLDTSQVESGGGGGGAPGGIAVGGGIGGIILLIIGLIFGIDTSGMSPDTSGSSQEQVDGTSGSSADFDKCKTGADANADVQCRVVGTVNSVNAFWAAELPRYQKQWQLTKTVIYTGSTQSQCGTASNQVGPFYCPLDQKVYIDADFFAILTKQFGADSGALAQEYVVAHEYGHALQDQLGLLGRAQQDPQGPNSGGVRIELMADCLAGVWAKNASTTNDASGKPFLKALTDTDIKSALSAASAVGDDRIQEKTQGQVNPESWTHGSAEARQRWFLQGYTKGDINSCNTFNVDTVS